MNRVLRVLVFELERGQVENANHKQNDADAKKYEIAKEQIQFKSIRPRVRFEDVYF